LENSGLVVFNGKMVMRLSFLDQVDGDLALGQQGIGGNFFALDIDGIKKRDGSFDFVSTLDGFVVYGQSPYFFWV
jgi:hypothetical protein